MVGLLRWSSSPIIWELTTTIMSLRSNLLCPVRAVFMICSGLLLLSGCRNAGDIPDELVVLTRNAPTTYYFDRNGKLAGPEYEMATAFARSLSRPVRFEVLGSVADILAALENGRGDLAAAGLTWTEGRAERFIAGPAYETVHEQVVCGMGSKVDDVSDLLGQDLAVIADSSYEATLEALREQLPDLKWKTISDRGTEQLLYDVAEGTIDCTVADSNIVAIHRRYLPRIETPLTIGTEEKLVWLLPTDSSALRDRIAAWFDEYQESGQLAALMNRYYGYLDRFDPNDIEVFTERIQERLPQYRPIFEDAAERTGLPWDLLAAVSYQESHWNPAATSPTGVRGMMMLTGETARSLDIADRLDPSESIHGGARYLRQRLELVPSYIPESDRLWMALAAYNIGQSHLRDARMLAVRLGENPNTWTGVKAALPHLSQSRYYRGLPSGYARGLEPVIYVERIRNYRDILEGFLSDQARNDGN